jgi:gamma-glutamylcyclotransferase (GGCT)/AIG2-like uncharacterized protein YtfP
MPLFASLIAMILLSMTAYFAYGSNLSSRQMLARCPGAAAVGPASLVGFQLAFDRPSRRWGGHAADVLPRPGSLVWGMLWEVSASDLAELDRFEGVASGAYIRANAVVALMSGMHARAEVYRVATPAVPALPSPRYLHVILEGAREQALPGDWIRHLATFRA